MTVISAMVATRYLAFGSGTPIAVNRRVCRLQIALPPADVDDIILDGVAMGPASRAER